MGAGPKMAPGGRNPMVSPDRGPMGGGRGPMGPDPFVETMGAGPKMAPGGRGPMGGGIAGPTMVSPGRKPNDGFSQMMGGAMGMKKGGKVSASKKNSGGKVNLGDAMKQKVDAMGMKKGGKVGGRGDGVAVKGKTKGRMC